MDRAVSSHALAIRQALVIEEFVGAFFSRILFFAGRSTSVLPLCVSITGFIGFITKGSELLAADVLLALTFALICAH